MKIKRFVDKDSRSAMAQVRFELGADAVIPSNKNVDGRVRSLRPSTLMKRHLPAMKGRTRKPRRCSRRLIWTARR